MSMIFSEYFNIYLKKANFDKNECLTPKVRFLNVQVGESLFYILLSASKGVQVAPHKI